MNAGDKVWIHNKSRMDYAFQDRIGTFVETTSNGYARVHLDGDLPTMRVLVHPESLSPFKDAEEILNRLRRGEFDEV